MATNYIAPGAQIIGDVTLGKDTSVWHNGVIRADGRKITIGEGSNVQDNATLHVEVGHDITMGDYVTVGHNAIVHACTIGNNVMVGMGAIVMTGAVIGDNSIIAAGALVSENKEIPAGSLVIGVPGKVVRQVTEQEIERTKENALHYVDMAKEYQEKA